MIKLLILAVVPFMTEHRNVTPKTEVSTNFYGSVTGIVDNAYIQAHGGGGGGGVDTNAVRDIIRDEITPTTNSLYTTLNDSIGAKRDKDDRAVYKLVKSAFVLHKDGLTDVTLPFIGKDQSKPYPYNEYDWVYLIGVTTAFHAIVFSDGQWKLNIADGAEYGYSSASEDALRIEFDNGYVATRSSIISTVPVYDQQLAAVATDNTLKPSDGDLVKYDAANDRFVKATAGTDYVKDISGKMDKVNSASHGFLVADENGNAQPSSLVDEITIGEMQLSLQNKADRATTLSGYGITDGAKKDSIAPEYSATSTYSVGTIVYHDGNIYQCKTAIADGGEAWNAEKWELRKLDDFFTNSNSLLTGTIESKVNSMFDNGDTTSYPRPMEG